MTQEVTDSSVTTHRLELPSELNTSPEQTEQLFLSLASHPFPISLEIVAGGESVLFQIAASQQISRSIMSHLNAHLPSVRCFAAEDALKHGFAERTGQEPLIVDFGLGKEWFLPLGRATQRTDTLIPLIAVMDGLADEEAVCLQVRFCRARGPWQRAARNVLFDRSGKLAFQRYQKQSSAIDAKLSAKLLAAAIRVAITSRSRARSLDIAKALQSYFSQFASPVGNELIPLKHEDVPAPPFDSFLERNTFRSGCLITTAELEGLFHIPSDRVVSRKLKRIDPTSKPAPEEATIGDLLLGINVHNNIESEIRLDSNKRTKHIHLIGASGSGKSTLLTSMMSQDLERGSGLACFDPHGDLIDAVLDRVPDDRISDVIVFDPSDEEFPVGFNILSAHSELEKTLLSSDLVGIFRRFATSWGDQMNSVLANAVLAFLESHRGGNLIDLKRFLVDKRYREEFLETVNDDEILYYWRREFPELRGKPHAPLLTRLDTFLRSKLIRHIVAQRDNKLDFRSIMDNQKILLVKLSLGAIGEENAYLLGSLLVAKIYMAALSRQEIAEEYRKPFFLYLDEAHHFVTPSLNHVLSGVRKYKIGLTIAHQQLAQFQKADPDILASLLSNCYTRICFRVDDADAERLAKGFSFFTSDHLRNLGVGEAIARFEQSQCSFNIKTFPTETVSTEIASARRTAVIEQSRKVYAKPRSEVEKDLRHDHTEFFPSGRENPTEIAGQRPESIERTVKKDIGRGGTHHQELQSVIRRMAEKLGFQVEIEKQILSSGERVDVSLETENLRIACEVSISTVDYEIHNAEKCLADGYDHVIIVASNRKKIPLIKRKINEEIPGGLQERVKVLGLMDLLAFLQQIAGIEPSSQSKTAKGSRLTLYEACELLGISSSTLYRWLREGRVPFFRVGREYQFDRDELLSIGKHDLSGKRKAIVAVEPIKVGKEAAKSKKEEDARYRKLLKLD